MHVLKTVQTNVNDEVPIIMIVGWLLVDTTNRFSFEYDSNGGQFILLREINV